MNINFIVALNTCFDLLVVITWFYGMCDNLIPWMALWKHYLLAGALAAAVASEILSLWSYGLRETRVPLPETVLQIVFRTTSQ
jgi:hypothetical protein